MSYMFSYCSSLTSLNLSNFNTNNVKEIFSIFNGLNKNCKIICYDKTILNKFSGTFEIYINPMDDFKKILNKIYKLFRYEYKASSLLENEYIYSNEDNSSFFEYLKSISKPNNQICNKFIDKGKDRWKCFDCEIDSNSLICSDCMYIHKEHKQIFIQNNDEYGFCNCGDSNMIKKEGFCSYHKGILNDEKKLMDYIKSSISIELTILNPILNKIFLLFTTWSHLFSVFDIKEKKNKETELFNVIECFYDFCSKLYENNFGFFNLILLKCAENFPFETNHQCLKYNEERKEITIIKENLFKTHTCTCPFFKILINFIFDEFSELLNRNIKINLGHFFSFFIQNDKIKLITGITFFHSFIKLHLNNNFIIFRKMAYILITDELSYIISDEKNFSFFEYFLKECYNTIKDNIYSHMIL